MISYIEIYLCFFILIGYIFKLNYLIFGRKDE
jgi:hypothetical protein